ncbi:helix-turn-helix transcriptional regulator [Bacillus sp. DTU_2020_1000418_1_SI_GHA_SEK_038]|uniref:helix-turn-helix transcriptional regulator n=1 Tax=Bacillus sp. DTU_2020_1000418_1_SI_GHA_SEK_038 TaxID=3077585 RepID=UPI0028ED7D74|nr:helix-turn-helix transcriptional regulator [Bacillus sp. DTU_2020_1000418_1_SI_GHA_SEK_038]WNS75711.1 helix-turn-helix transcriptional regulator [Bacillus sp. DTU_2020_1000418_1_SI_GHA_SEK_038]
MLNEPCLNYGLGLRKIRERLGITQSQLAKATETTENTIINLELSKMHPTDHFIEKIGTSFYVNPFELKKSIGCDQELETCNTTL